MKNKVRSLLAKMPMLKKFLLLYQNRNKILQTLPTKIVNGKNNNIRISNSALLFNCVFEISGNNNIIEIDDLAVLNNLKFHISGDNHLVNIGKGVRFNNKGSIWLEDNNCEVNIGENTTIEDADLAITEPKSILEIGKNCMFAYDIDIKTGDSHSIIDIRNNKRVNYAKKISIGNHVWIASHVSILKGVSINDDSIVATRSLVTKSFEQKNVIIGGVPAIIIKENITWDKMRIYERVDPNIH